MSARAEVGITSLKEKNVFSLFASSRTPVSRRLALLNGSLAAALVAAGLILLPGTQSHAQAPLKPDVDIAELMKPGELPDNVMGKDDAPYTIVEYSSMTCPHCARFHTQVLPEIKKKFIDTGKAKYIIREFPLDNVAAAAFMLARCVDKSKYFDFVDLLYSNQEEWAFSGNALPGLQKFAKQIGFTEEKFNECLKDEKLLKYIEWVRDRGNTQFDVHATPTFFINGKRLKGGELDDFEKIIGGTDGKS